MLGLDQQRGSRQPRPIRQLPQDDGPHLDFARLQVGMMGQVRGHPVAEGHEALSTGLEGGVGAVGVGALAVQELAPGLDGLRRAEIGQQWRGSRSGSRGGGPVVDVERGFAFADDLQPGG